MAGVPAGGWDEAKVRSAISASNLCSLPDDAISELTVGATTVHVPAGTCIHREGETDPHLELVIRGLVRAHVSAPDGRTMTVRYCRRGALIGVATLFADTLDRPFAVQALTDTELLRMRPSTARAIAERDVLVARALLAETSERVLSFVAELSGIAFATVRQRLARHLLDLVADQLQGGELVAHVTQQDLADAIGTVREVVVRVLREFRDEGVVATSRRGITIQDPERLFSSTDPWGGT